MSTEEAGCTSTQMEGKFKFVGLDIDTTGRRLIDEIIHIAAYTPEESFSQYIMPLMNLNPGARQRHHIRVINVGFFRMLKSLQTYKVIKTKTEIAAIMDFLNWLEKVKGTDDGIIFLYHEQIKLMPYMLIEVMKKYNLYSRFEKVAKGFVCGYDLCSDVQKGNGLKYLTLCQNYKIQTDQLGMAEKERDEFEGNAAVRAKLSYEICKLLSFEGEKKDRDEKETAETFHKFITTKTKPLTAEVDELLEIEESIDRQTAMRNIFVTYFSASPYHRRRALTFRTALADAKQSIESLQETWNKDKREGLENIVKSLDAIKEEDREELIKILEHHFDEEKKPFTPPNNREGGNRRNYNGRSNGRMRRRSQRRSNGGGNNKENHEARSTSRRGGQRSYNKRRFSNSNNANEQKGENSGKEQQQPIDVNQNLVAAAN